MENAITYLVTVKAPFATALVSGIAYVGSKRIETEACKLGDHTRRGYLITTYDDEVLATLLGLLPTTTCEMVDYPVGYADDYGIGYDDYESFAVEMSGYADALQRADEIIWFN